MITTIDGWAGAGKTTLAAHLAETFADRGSVFTVHMDDLYEGWQDPLGSELTQSLLEIVQAHRAGAPYHFHAYDWQLGARGARITVPIVDHLILEGVGSGQRAIREFADTKIWVEIEPILGLRRVLLRDAQESSDLVQLEREMLRFQELAAAHFATEGTLFAADFEVNGAGSL
jgi:uridine kinase